MENNRWTKRRPLHIQVLVSVTGRAPIHAWARDISLGGIYVETDAELPRCDDMVDLEFALDDDPAAGRHRLAGQVVHAGTRGMGVMFCDFSAHNMRLLREQIYRGEPVR